MRLLADYTGEDIERDKVDRVIRQAAEFVEAIREEGATDNASNTESLPGYEPKDR